MAQGRDVGGRCTFAQHLENGVAGNQVNQQEDQRDNEPDDRDGEDKTGEDLLHGLGITINQWTVVSSQ